jgi:hypothetical protein
MIHLAFLSIFWHPLGQCAGSAHEVARCRSYNWWSGIAADFSELTMLAILATLFRHLNCHVNTPHFCLRFGHPVAGTSFRACKKHHPHRESDGTVTAAHISDALTQAQAAYAGDTTGSITIEQLEGAIESALRHEREREDQALGDP